MCLLNFFHKTISKLFHSHIGLRIQPSLWRNVRLAVNSEERRLYLQASQKQTNAYYSFCQT